MGDPDPAVGRPPVARVVKAACAMGAALVLGTTAIASGGGLSPFLFVFAAWALLPYVLLWLLPRWVSNPWVAGGAAVAVVLGETYVRAEVFYFPQGSTAALALLFSPLYLICIALPAGMALGWALGLAWRWSGIVGRGAIVVLGGVGALLAMVAFLRPDLLPARFGRAVSAKVRIGAPRVVMGEADFRKARLSTRAAWYQVGEIDDTPGEDLVAIDSRGATLLDPAAGDEKGTIPFSAQAGRKWNWFSRLVREGPEPLIVQTGGGYSDVEVLDLGGRVRWGFRPQPDLPPVALLPRDLDGDGGLEFYAAARQSVYRLDGSGKVAWERTVRGLVDSLDAGPEPPGHRGLVVAVDSFRTASVWDPEGLPLKQFPLPGAEYRYTLVNWPLAPALIGGSRAVKVIDLDGRLVVEHPLGDFLFARAVGVQLDAAGPPHLAVLAAAPREVGLWRLIVFSAAAELLYDEILPGGGALLAARDGSPARQVLLLSDGKGLVAYRRSTGPAPRPSGG